MNNAPNNKNDAIDRKIGFVERIFDKFFAAVNKDLKGFFIVILVITNLITFWKYSMSLEARLTDNQEYSERIIEEVRRRIVPDLNKRMNQKVQNIETKVDSAAQGVNSLQETINKAIEVMK